MGWDDGHGDGERPGDLDAVVAAMGQRHFFTDRLARQAAGHGLMLLAWQHDQVCGDVYVWQAPADEPQIRQHLAGVPLLNHLEVHPDHRGRGIGTLLIHTAENLLRDAGHRRVALGVGVDNPRARTLYLRLGYHEWDHGTVQTSYQVHDPGGQVRLYGETIHVLAKHL